MVMVIYVKSSDEEHVSYSNVIRRFFFAISVSVIIPITYPAPDSGISITRLTGGGGGIFCSPPQNSGTTGRICKLQAAFDRSGKFVEGNLMLLTSGSPMTSQVR